MNLRKQRSSTMRVRKLLGNALVQK